MYMLFFVYMYYVHISCASLTALSLSPLYYVYVQASRTRVSEAYTELESTFEYEKLESNIILNDYFNVSDGQQQRNQC